MQLLVNRNVRFLFLPIVLTICLVAFGFHCCIQPVTVHAANKPGWYEERQLVFKGIPARVLLFSSDDNGNRMETVAAGAWKLLSQLGRVFNPFSPNSELAKLNRRTSANYPLNSRDLIQVWKLSKQLHHFSNGAFDPTVWKIKKMWEKAEKSQQEPDRAKLKRLLETVGFEKCRLNDQKKPAEVVCHNAAIGFDFGGIAKGYIVDRMAAYIKKQGVQTGLIQLGGEIKAFGCRPNRVWQIGVQHPLDLSALWGMVSSKCDIGVSTSGNYRQPYLIRGKQFYHIFDPRTGWPVSAKTLGVTTLSVGGAVSCAMLDGLATAITTLGPQKGIKLTESLKVDALIIQQHHPSIVEKMTPGFRAHFRPMVALPDS